MSMEPRIIGVTETLPLRLKVLRPGGVPADCHFPSDEHPEAFHVGVFDAGCCICIGSFSPERHPGLAGDASYRLRGMATDPEHQGRGAGRVLLEHALAVLRQRGCTLLWCNARLNALGFYERSGFAVQGEQFDIPGIGPHFLMWRRV
jgi:GNAT superfamily N-acetyltransferase